MKYILLVFLQIYFKIEQDLDRGHELVMGPRHPLHFDLCGNLTENRYDRESSKLIISFFIYKERKVLVSRTGRLYFFHGGPRRKES